MSKRKWTIFKLSAVQFPSTGHECSDTNNMYFFDATRPNALCCLAQTLHHHSLL